jgi:N-acetylmuramoyl-L-alanine amidase
MVGKYLGGYRNLGICTAIGVAAMTLTKIAPAIATPGDAAKSLYISYPPTEYKTASDSIFLIGSAPLGGNVSINQKILPRSKNGHFASVFSLQVGANTFRVQHQGATKLITVTRLAPPGSQVPKNNFVPGSLEPQGDLARLPGELICFGAGAPSQAKVSVNLGGQDIKLQEQKGQVNLPDNKAALIDRNQPQALYGVGKYLGCAIAAAAADLGKPTYTLEMMNDLSAPAQPVSLSQTAPGNVQILSPLNLDVAEVIVEGGITRTGPSSDYSRLTPLPKGTRAAIVGRQTGDNNGKQANWVRLDYGAWILAEEIKVTRGLATPPKTIVRSVMSKDRNGATDVIFPLQVAVPIEVEQGTNNITLTLYNTTAQSDIIRFNDNPIVSRLDWRQTEPGIVKYTFSLKNKQQWGYQVKYQGTSLVFSLRHPPGLGNLPDKPLAGTKILLDPGHGGDDSGAVGPNGYKEKDANLYASKLLANELAMRGATVYLSREVDKSLSLEDRRKIIDRLEPTLAFSIHFNSLPDGGNPNTKGFSTFWYHPQAQDIAKHLHNYVTQTMGRPSYGVYWNNLALARPASAPSVLLELGFMSNPQEFDELIASPQQQQIMAKTLADGITQWLQLVINN